MHPTTGGSARTLVDRLAGSSRAGLILAALALTLSACTPTLVITTQPSHIVWGQSITHRRAADLNIPPGQLPPPGKCRIWYPDRPAGQQPPPGDCRELEQRLPPDAVLVNG